MNHIHRFAKVLEDRLGLPAVVEPSRAQSAAHLRLLVGPLALTEIWQDAEKTDLNYLAAFEITVSARLTGGNEGLALTHQGMDLAVRLAEFFSESFVLVGSAEELPGGLWVDGEAVINSARRGTAGFLRLSDDEESAEARLFAYREDWTVTLSARVARPFAPPRLSRVAFDGFEQLVIPPDAP